MFSKFGALIFRRRALWGVQGGWFSRKCLIFGPIRSLSALFSIPHNIAETHQLFLWSGAPIRSWTWNLL